MSDLRQAYRSLRNAPGFVSAAVLTLSLGIGATSVVFSFVNGLLLRPLPFGDATDRIVSLHGIHPTQFPEDWDDANASYADLEDVRRMADTFEDVAMYTDKSITLYGDEAVRVLGGVVTPNLFDLLGVAPVLGRNFRQAEGARVGFETVVILGHGLWQSRFGGDPDIIGRPILMNERELTVIGIMPEHFRFPERSDLWLPYDPGEGSDRSARWLLGVSKLKEQASLTEARLELESISERLASLHPESNRGWSVHALPYRELLVDARMKVTAAALLVSIGLVLLIGCANLASLLLARGLARYRELAVRSALGAGRAVLIRQMLVESLLLGSAGGVLGFVFASWSLDAMVASFPEELPYWLSFHTDWRVLSFVVGLSLATGILFGLLPALRVSKVSVASALGGGRDPHAGNRALGYQNALIVGQVALSLALLVGAGLMYLSFLNVSRANPGFDERSILTLQVYLSGDAYDPVPTKVAFFRDAVEHVRRVPGVLAATATTAVPADDGGSSARVVTKEHPVIDGTEIGVQVVGATPGFFETLDVSLVEGRRFEAHDMEDGAPRVAIVNEALASRLFGTDSALDSEIGLVTSAGISWTRVIGVSPHIQYEEFSEETPQSQLNMFVPYSATPFRGMAILARTDGEPGRLASSVREAMHRFAPSAAVFLIRTMDEVRHMTSWENRFFSRLFNGFAVAAALLACLGIYGLVAYRVGLRRREVGIRIALGADSRNVRSLLLGQGMVPAAIGIGLGLLLSLAVSRGLASVLYEVPSDHATMYVAAAAILSVPIVLASYLPARRAASIAPATTLRDD